MNHPRLFIFAATTLSATMWANACGEGTTDPPPPPPDPPRPTTVTVSPATAELAALGATVQLSAEVRDQNGQVIAGATVAWASDNAPVATVDGSGLVTGVAEGMATITATAGAVSGSATVSVAQRVSAVTVSPAADTLVEGDTLRLAAEATDANGHPVAEAEFSWASSDTSVAVVDDAGFVTAVGLGQAEVTATAAGVTARADLTVVARAPTTVAVTPDTVALAALGQTAQLAAEVRDQIGRVMEGVPVAWSSAGTTVAVVDAAGLVTATGVGETTIAATSGEASGEAVVTVMQSAGSVTVSPAVDTIAPGDTLRLVAEAFDANGHAVTGAEFSWESSDDAVATVDGSGLVTAAGNGTATITATVGDVRGESMVTVAQPSLVVGIPDGSLRAVIEAALGKDGGEPIYDTEMQTLSSLYAGGPGRVGGGIRDLTGLEHARNLRELVLHSNNITDLGPLRALAKLQRLNLHAINHYYYDPPPPLDYSPLAGLSELTWLDLGYNHTPDISPLAGLGKLEHLNGVNNRIKDISPLAALTSLRVAILAHNDISDLGPLANNPGLGNGSEIDVRANPLTRLSIRDHVPALQSRGATILFDDLVVFSEPEIFNGNLFVLPVDENLAASGRPSLDWTRQFYEHFDDDFDFLVFVLNLYTEDYPEGNYRSTFRNTHNDVRGIGQPISSDDRWPDALQGVVVHGTVAFSVDSRSIIHSGPMLHELMHRWANSIVAPSPGSGPHCSGPHWGFSSANGVLGGFDIADLVDHGGGRYSAGDLATHGLAANAKPYSPIELYLAGFLPPEEVPDLWVAEDGQWVDHASGNQMFTASRVRNHAIEDIVEMQGSRVPDHSQSQREFRAATVLLVDDHHPVTRRNLNQLSDDISWFSRNADDGDDRVYNFFEATGGRATIDMNDLSRSASQRVQARAREAPQRP